MRTRFRDDFKLFGLSEKTFRDGFSGCVDQKNATVDVSADGLDLRVSLGAESREESYDLFLKKFLREFGKYIYACRDVSLKEQLIDLLKLNSYKLSTAESFTGGGVASRIISVPGASEIFYEGIVAYDCEAKKARLGVSQKTLDDYKPVSANVAIEMAKGLMRGGKCDVAVSTTGIAGPDSDDSRFPVGLCYIGVAYAGEINAYKYNFTGDRDAVINNGVNAAIFQVIKNIQREVNLC